MMTEIKSSPQPNPPWQGDRPRQPSEAESPSEKFEEPPKERSLFELAAELKNLIRGDRMRRSERMRNFP